MQYQPSPSSQHKASPVEMLRLKDAPPPGSSPTHEDQESELKQLLQEAASLESRGHIMQSLHVRERALLVQYTQTLTEIDSVAHGNVSDPQVRPYVDATVKRARTLVLQLNGAAVRLFKADDFDSAGQLLSTAIKLCDSTDNYSYFFDNWEMRLELKSTTYNNLGCMERRRGRLAVGLQYLRQALELPATPSAALHLNVSGVLAQLGRTSEALYAANKAITVADESHGVETVPFPGLRAVARHNLSTILEKTDLKQAVTVAAEAVQIAEQELGASSPTTVPIRQTFNRLQAVLLRQEQEELIRAEAEREQAERQKEIQLAEDQRKASLRSKSKRGGVRNQYQSINPASGNTPQSKQNQQNQQQQPKENMTAGQQGHNVVYQTTGGTPTTQQPSPQQQQTPTTSSQQQQQQQQQTMMQFSVADSTAAAMANSNVAGGDTTTTTSTSNLGRKGGAIGFVGAVRRVPDTRQGYDKDGNPLPSASTPDDGRQSAVAQSGTSKSGSRPNSAVSFFANSGTSSPTGGGAAGTSSDQQQQQQQPHQHQKNVARSLTDRLMRQANSAGLTGGIALPKPQVVRTVATEEAALGDVVNFLSHRLGALLKNEEMDTKKFAAARCIQCAMRVALAKNELNRRKVRRFQNIQVDLDDENEAAHLIISFFLRLRERRRRYKEDRRIAADTDRHHHKCAIQIQTLVRLWRAKRILMRLRKIRSKESTAAIVIQRQVRRVLAFAAVSRLRGARAQARYQRFGIERLEYAAQVIQRAYRMHRARNQKLIRQGHFKQALQRDWRALRNHSAILIQTIARGFLTRKHSAPVLQERNKLRRNREISLKRLRAAKILQAVGRAYFERNFLLGKAYPVFVRCREVEMLKRREVAACVIQRAIRCHLAHCELKHLRQERYQEQNTQKQGVLMLSQRQLHKFGTDSLGSSLTLTQN